MPTITRLGKEGPFASKDATVRLVSSAFIISDIEIRRTENSTQYNVYGNKKNRVPHVLVNATEQDPTTIFFVDETTAWRIDLP